MRVVHLIPSSFDYFDDIRSEAFGLTEAEHSFGVEVEVFTLQYGAFTKGVTERPTTLPPVKRKFSGKVEFSAVLEQLSEFDVVHVHCPFFGGLKKLIRWKQDHSKIPIVVTVYREVLKSDLFSYVVAWYNNLYLPKLFEASAAVATTSVGNIAKSWAKKIKYLALVDYSPQFQETDLTFGPDGKRLTPEERLALKYIIIYEHCVQDKLM